MTKFLPETSAETQTTVAPALTPKTAGGSVGTSDAPAETVLALLLETAENAEQKRRRFERMDKGIGALLSVVFVALLLAQIANIAAPRLSVPSLMKSLFIFIAINGLIQAVFLHLRGVAPSQQRDFAARLLTFLNEPRLLLPLLDGLRAPQTPEWKGTAYPLLTERLWNLSAADATLSLDDTRRATLRQFLGSAYGFMPVGKRKVIYPNHFDDLTTDLAVAIMKTLAVIGDTQSARVLKKIINAQAKTPNEEVVRDAAREYLPALRQKIAQNEAVQRKLRVCLREKIRDPQKMLAEYLDTLAPEEAKVALMDFLRYQKRHDLISRAMCQAIVLLLGICGICAYFFLTLIFDFDQPRVILSGGMGAAFAFLINVFVNEGKVMPPSVAVQNTVHELSRRVWDDTRFAGFLLSALQKGMEKPHADAVKKTLVRLLPQLKPGDAALVPPAQRAYLRSWLKLSRKQKKRRTSYTMTIAALDAFAALGDTRALPQAENIARQSQANYRGGELQNAALRCAEALRARKTSG